MLIRCVVATTLLACLAVADAAAQQPRTYTLGTDPWIAWTPIHVADQKGYWRDQGLSVRVVVHEGGETPAALRAGRLDFATVMAGTAVGATLDGRPTVILAEIDWSHGGDKLLVRAGTDLAACKGQRIAVYEDSPAVTFFLDHHLRALGLSVDDFQVIGFDDMEPLVRSFLDGRFCALVGYEPFVQKALVGGKCRVLATTADHPGCMPEVLAAPRDRLATVPAADLDKLMRGYIRAVQWCADPAHGREYEKITCERNLIEPHDSASLAAMLANVRVHDVAALRARNGATGGLHDFLQELVPFAAGRRGATAPQHDQMIDTRALRRVLPEFEPGAVPGK